MMGSLSARISLGVREEGFRQAVGCMCGVHTDNGGFAEAACVVNVLHVLR